MHLDLGPVTELKILDPRGHSAETLLRVRQALASGAPATPDTRRPDFFEIQDGDRVFYIHLSPATRKITLLATWSHEPELETVSLA